MSDQPTFAGEHYPLRGAPGAGNASEITSTSAATDGTPGRWLTRKVPSFRHRNYRLFFAGQLVSVTGTWMESLAQSWLVLSLTSSAFYLGLVPVAQFLPAVILSLFGGLVADRLPKRRILMATQFGAAMLSLTMSVLIFSDRVQLWHVYLIAALLGIVNSMDTPARQSFVSEMVAKEDLVQAISLNSAVFNAGRLVGPAMAGIVLAAIGPAWCFLVNGLSFFAVIIQLQRMDDSQLFKSAARRTTGRIRDGITYALNNRPVLLTIILIGCVSTLAMNFNVWMPLLAKKTFGLGAGGFGLMMSMLGIGSMCGALFLAFIGKRRPPITFIPISAAILGVLEIGLAITGLIPTPLLFALLVLPLCGFTMTFTASMANSSVQMLAPDHLRGRVLAFYFMVFNSGMPLGALLTGATAHEFGAPGSILLSAIVCLIAAGIVIYLTRHEPSTRDDLTTASATSTAD
jgi:MFS family permease